MLSARLAAAAALATGLGLLAGAAWAAAPRDSAATPVTPTASITVRSDTTYQGGPGIPLATPRPTPTPNGLLLRPNLAFNRDAVNVTVSGSGFATPGVVFVELVRDLDQPGAIIGGAVVNKAGAFDVTATMDLGRYAGTYAVLATASDGTVATTPLTMVISK